MTSNEPSGGSIGEFLRAQRRLANLSLRQLAELANVSNPYLSQIERGIYKPSARVLKGLADALDISAETIYKQVGLLDPATERGQTGVEEAVRLDEHLTTNQKEALLRVYRGFVERSGS